MINNSKDLEGIKLLIVEDDKNSARLLIDFLGIKGAEIRYVSNGSDAINLAEHYNFDVIIVDLRLPGENGFMVAENIKRFDKKIVPSIIAISAFSDKQNRIRALESGADAFFSKPIDLQELLLLVKNFSIQKKNYFKNAFGVLEQINELGENKLHRSGHSEAVLTLCKKLGEINEINESQFPLLIQAAKLHDLGLMYSTNQQDNSHGEIAADLILKAGLPSELAILVKLHHQSRFDANDVIQEQLGDLLRVLQQAEKVVEVYCSVPEEFQNDIAAGLLNQKTINYIQGYLKR